MPDSARWQRIETLAVDLVADSLTGVLDDVAAHGLPGRQVRFYVHRAVMAAFLAQCPRYQPRAGQPSRARLAELAVELLALTQPEHFATDIHDGSRRPNGFESGKPGLALLWLGDRCPPPLAERVRQAVVGAADWYLDYHPKTGLYYDTKAEETAWEIVIPAIAQALCPDHPHRAAWHAQTRKMALNSYSREEDVHDQRTRYDGLPLADLVHTANVSRDFTVANHEGWNPVYQVCHNTMAPAFWLYRERLGGVPPWFTHNWAGLHDVTRRLVLGDGHLAWPAGSDYFPGTHVGFANYHALMAAALGCGVSLWALEQVLTIARRHQLADPRRRLFQGRYPTLHPPWEDAYTAMVLPALYLGPFTQVPELSDEAVLAATTGTLVSQPARTVVQHSRRLFCSFSWDPVYAKGQALAQAHPHDDGFWTEGWTCDPHLIGTVRLQPSQPRQLYHAPLLPGEFDHGQLRESDPLELYGRCRTWLQGQAGPACWSLGQLLDDSGDALHVVGMLLGPDAAIHIERFVRYGEKHAIAHAETLNYLLTNAPADRAGFHVAWAGGEAQVAPGSEWVCPAPGEVVVFDRKLAVVRCWGDTALQLAQHQRPTPVHGHCPRRPWRLRLWGQRPGPVAPHGYAILAEQVTLIVPAATVAEAQALAAGVRVDLSPLGEGTVTIGLPCWHATYRLQLGQRLGCEALE